MQEINQLPIIGKKISENPVAGPLTGEELFSLVQQDQNRVITFQELRNTLGGIIAGMPLRGFFTDGDDLGTPAEKGSYLVSNGTYHINNENLIVIESNLGVLFWDGQIWDSLEVPVEVDLSSLATKTSLQETFDQTAHYGKLYNEVAIGNDDLSFWTNNPGVTTTFENPPGILPFPFIKKAIKMTAPANTPAFITYRIPAVAADRLVMGAWFHIPDLDVPNNEGFGFYGQVIGNTTEARQVQFLRLELTPANIGLTKTSFEFSSRIEQVAGDWVFISMWNTGHMAAGTTAFAINPYMKGNGIANPYNFYVENISLLKGVSVINPSLVYDNASFGAQIDRWLESNESSKFNPIEAKVFNELKAGDNNEAFWTKGAGVTMSYEWLARRRFLYKKQIKLTVNAGVNGYIGRKISAVSTDRIACGGWFYIPTLDQPNVSQFAVFGQMEVAGGATTNRPVYFTKADLVRGTTKSNGEFTSRIEAVNGNWAYLLYWNHQDFLANLAFFVFNAYVVGSTTAAPYTATWANLTLVKGVSSLKPYGTYDNSAFVTEQVMEIAATKDDLKPFLTVDTKWFNELFEGSANIDFWSLPSANHTKAFAPSPGSLPFEFPKQALKVTAPTGQNAYAIRAIPVSIAERVVVSAWFNKKILDTANVANIGFYMQINRSDNSVLQRQVQFTQVQLIVGATKTNSETLSTVEAIAGDWVCISVKNTADFPANSVAYVVNCWVGSAGAGKPIDLHVNNFTFLRNRSAINPFVVYDNSAFGYEIAKALINTFVPAGPLKNKRVVVDGDSIMKQLRVTNNIAARTGCTIVMRAESGSGYVNNVNGTIRSRVTGIVGQNPDCILIAGGTNDYGTNKPLGSAAVLNDDMQFYSAVYNTFRVLREQNPAVPVLICTPIQRGEPRGTVNTLGFSLKQYSEVIKECAAIFGIPCLDMYSLSGITYENRATYLPDDLHPNDAGGIKMGGTITTILNSILA
ncbi:SGNH/GDSL hydrolase family protein [Pedobacter sp. SYP-B3415]|uniref:SGNH/GDSL hydrolase family protein n=1 Tax=Pedobacter sp. SYP-B3415 TaxID=2496641 RepID=UPI00101C3EE1|nr:SGNH/GDSL hydrolase family protein [Pedobacter sp. SYP-B3415]